MILVVGATGTVGRKVVETLMSNPNIPLRTLARGKSDWEGSVLPSFRRKGVEVMVGDLRSRATVEKAVKGATAIVNCAGAMRALPDDDLESINIDGVENLVELGKEAGVQRFIQLSCLGATEHATSLYFGCKWDAEELVRKSGLFWTVFRPSLIFDYSSSLYRVLEFWISRSPIIFVVGSGLNRFQPISADDVANCIAQSLYDRETVGKTFDLVGPDTLDLNSLLSLHAEKMERSARFIRIPSFLGVPLAGLLGKLNPRCPIDNNVMQVLTSEMISDDEAMRRFNLNLLSIKSKSKAVSRTDVADDSEESDEDEDDDE